MFGIAAVVLFLLSYVLNGFNVGNQWVGPHPLAYLGLACLALHVLGVAAGIPWRRAS